MKKQLSKSERKDIAAELRKQYGIADPFGKKDSVEIFRGEGMRVLLINGTPAFFYHHGVLVPHLRLLLDHDILKRITVDMGAVRFVTNGADVMRPGITAITDGIAAGDSVVVVDETHGKPLAVCEALACTEDMRAMDKGKALKNLHHIGDQIWKQEF